MVDLWLFDWCADFRVFTTGTNVLFYGFLLKGFIVAYSLRFALETIWNPGTLSWYKNLIPGHWKMPEGRKLGICLISMDIKICYQTNICELPWWIYKLPLVGNCKNCVHDSHSLPNIFNQAWYGNSIQQRECCNLNLLCISGFQLCISRFVATHLICFVCIDWSIDFPSWLGWLVDLFSDWLVGCVYYWLVDPFVSKSKLNQVIFMLSEYSTPRVSDLNINIDHKLLSCLQWPVGLGTFYTFGIFHAIVVSLVDIF